MRILDIKTGVNLSHDTILLISIVFVNNRFALVLTSIGLIMLNVEFDKWNFYMINIDILINSWNIL